MNDTLFWLTATVFMTGLLWVPYILEAIVRIGLLPALSLATPDENKLAARPEWSERARKAHSNAVENLVILAPLALIASHIGISVTAAVQAYFAARLLHYIVYTAGIGFLRTLCFFGGFFAQAYIAMAIFNFL